MNILVVGLGKSGTTVISKSIQHSLPDCRYFLEPTKTAAFAAPPPGHNVFKILVNQWTEDPEGLRQVLDGAAGATWDRRIFILRDPRDALVSLLLYSAYNLALDATVPDAGFARWLEVLRAKEADPDRVTLHHLFARFKETFGWDWPMNYLLGDRGYWNLVQGSAGNGFHLRYEDFIDGKLAGLEAYLGFPLASRRDVDDLGRTRRTGRHSNWKDFFLPDDVAAITPEVRQFLAEYGYTDWTLNDRPSVATGECSGYVTRLILEARPTFSETP